MVGGEGEEFTLRITAQHADSWNLPSRSAAFDVARDKLDVLRAHCDTYGRDYDDIEKSWFTRCVIRETQEEVDELLDEVPRFRNPTETENPLVGTPADVAAEIERYRDELGMEECVVEFIDFPQTTGAELFADEVLPQF
jgi:alkanesulfonate monooxygenase SsuD/methylene tetrahydromethanopterin reductase-like flavin-dependent oxidoreductase (luciferase family)